MVPMAIENILMVDERPDREFAAYILQKEGYSVDVVGGLEQARARLAQGRPDVLIVDCQPACAESVQLVENLKSDPLTAEIPIVAFTACPHLADPCPTCQSGFDRAIPAQMVDQLPATLDELLRGPVA